MGHFIENLKAYIKQKFNKDWSPGPFPFQDTSLSFEERAKDIVSRLSLKEKAKQMCSRAPAVYRLGIPKYHWWNECLHGVGRAGLATVFPQAIGLAATFNPDLMGKIAKAISDEARAKHYQAIEEGNEGKRYFGLTYWSPNINIFRDPRWGRGQETYGEDPYLTAQMGIQFVKGLQGDDEKYLKLVATPKHYVVHSGPEGDRHSFNAIATKKDLRETYLYAFKECVEKGDAYSIMGAYNRTNGELCCASPTYLQQILREEFGFEGFVVSDCGAIRDFHANHKVTKNRFESAAVGVKNGCDLNCGLTYRFLKGAVKRGMITEEEIDKALFRLFLARMKLGMFDPPEKVPFSKISHDVVDSDEHRRLALQTAKEVTVLLKNKNNLLPLNQESSKDQQTVAINNIAVIGPNADDKEPLWGNYNGTPSYTITPFEGLKNYGHEKGIEVEYSRGCPLVKHNEGQFQEAQAIAENSDLIVMALGISNEIEGEQKRTGGDDRKSIQLPAIQKKLVKFIRKHNPNTPIILLLINGSPISVSDIHDEVDAILETWYGGQEAGNAIVDILFGKYSPSGKMPITVPHSVEDLPPLRDYDMSKGRTYKYLKKEPLYPFGFGLSYTTISYSHKLNTPINTTTEKLKDGKLLKLPIGIKNTGTFDGQEKLQLYIQAPKRGEKSSVYELRGIKTVYLHKDQEKELEFSLNARDFARINQKGECILKPGSYSALIGPNQPDQRSVELGGLKPLEIKITIEGDPKKVGY